MSIEVKNLQVSYEKNVIIPHMDIQIPEEKITVLIGRNGCGKSTFLKAVTGIIPFNNGTVMIDGVDRAKISSKDVARKMAVLPQSPKAPEGLTVKELVSYGRFPYQKAFGGMSIRDLKMVDWAMKETHVYEYKEKLVESLSGGQRQRAWIAMAIAQETKLLLLDEPTTYLDLSHQLEILELLQKLNQKNKTTIVMVLHELNQAAKFADHIIGMKKGEVLFEGAPCDVITEDNLRNLYHIEAALQKNEEKGYPICIDYELVKDDEE